MLLALGLESYVGEVEMVIIVLDSLPFSQQIPKMLLNAARKKLVINQCHFAIRRLTPITIPEM
jgi:hypothetical protein